MPNIRILPEILSNKIAAGEVVERPASVVKELIENALDAGSDRIVVEIESGGRRLIRVSDNGSGMGRDDALLSIERYATSKIRTDADLFAITSLGFRGEALPSIASVSHFSLTTRIPDADVGTEIRVDGGTVKQVKETGAAPGTVVSVGQLFYNTPARRKFLKTVNTEMGHISDVVATMALARPEVQFRLRHNGRMIKNWGQAPDPKQRVADVLGRELMTALIPLSLSAEGVSVTGWAASPNVVRTTAGGIFIYVNGRCVRDRTIRHALLQGYAGRLVKGQFPVAVLFLELPADRVDVNVHPAKHEVRYAEARQVHDRVAEAVSRALFQYDTPRWGEPVSEHRVAERTPSYGAPSGDRARPTEKGTARRTDDPTETPAAPLERPAPPRQEPLHPAGRFQDLRVIGQYLNTYIVAEIEGRLLLIDQHAAHERVYYEQLLRSKTTGRPASQHLLVPEMVELGYKESEALASLGPELAAVGLGIEPFGGNTFRIVSVPAFMADRAAGPLVTEIAETAVQIGVAGDLDRVVNEALALTACHAVIRANQSLTDPEIRTLLRELDACDNPSHCPHGRPTFIEWSRSEIERLFKRIL